MEKRGAESPFFFVTESNFASLCFCMFVRTFCDIVEVIAFRSEGLGDATSFVKRVCLFDSLCNSS